VRAVSGPEVRLPPSPREWREGRVDASRRARRRPRGAPGSGTRRWGVVEVLYAATALVVVAAAAFALLGVLFPGGGDTVAGTCDGPLSPGCPREEDWPFVALILGGPLAAALLVLAVASHVVRAVVEAVRGRWGR
jgi:hypothetical protein